MLKINTSKSLVIYTCILGDGYFLPKVPVTDSTKYLFKNNHVTDFHRWPHAYYSRPQRYYSFVTNQIIPAMLPAEREANEKLKIFAELKAAIAELYALISERGATPGKL